MTTAVSRPKARIVAAALAARGVVKRFGPVLAVDHVDFELRPPA